MEKEGRAMPVDIGALLSAPGRFPLRGRASLGCSAPALSRPSRSGAFVRSLRLRSSFARRRSFVGARVACRLHRRGAPPFGRVP